MTFGKWILFIAAAFILAVWSGALDVRIDWRSPAANAIDLFGSDEEEEGKKQTSQEDAAAGDPFWSEGSGRPEITLPGMPRSFADLAEQASPAVVNIRTSKTVKRGKPQLPRGFEEFFGNPFEEG